jgi:hypothetical protein
MFKVLFFDIDKARETVTLLGIEVFGFRIGIDCSFNEERVAGENY